MCQIMHILGDFLLYTLTHLGMSGFPKYNLLFDDPGTLLCDILHEQHENMHYF